MRTSGDLFNKCNRDGEEKVRRLLAEKTYCTHDEIPIIEEWLRRKDEERSLKREEENNKIALDMLDAAKRQATAAETAASSALEQARIARTAKNIAIIAAVVGIITLIVNIIISIFIESKP